MARLKRSLSNRVVGALPVGGRDVIYWDRDLAGFGVRVYRSGSRVYLVQGRGPHGTKRVAIGRHGVLSAQEARRRGAAVLARIKAGAEPPPLPDGDGTPTVAELAERYLREYVAVRCKPATVRRYRQLISQHIVPMLGALPVAGVGRVQMAELHYRLLEGAARLLDAGLFHATGWPTRPRRSG